MEGLTAAAGASGARPGTGDLTPTLATVNQALSGTNVLHDIDRAAQVPTIGMAGLGCAGIRLSEGLSVVANAEQWPQAMQGFQTLLRCRLCPPPALQDVIDRIMSAQAASGSGAAGVVDLGGDAGSLSLGRPVTLAGGLGCMCTAGVHACTQGQGEMPKWPAGGPQRGHAGPLSCMRCGLVAPRCFAAHPLSAPPATMPARCPNRRAAALQTRLPQAGDQAAADTRAGRGDREAPVWGACPGGTGGWRRVSGVVGAFSLGPPGQVERLAGSLLPSITRNRIDGAREAGNRLAPIFSHQLAAYDVRRRLIDPVLCSVIVGEAAAR